MAGEFIGVEIAVIIVTASILLAGILVGVGRAFNYKRIEHFGIEELIQSVINAAIIGAFAAIIELVNAVSSSLVAETCVAGDAIAQLICTLENLDISMFSMFQELVRMTEVLGYYQSIALVLSSITIQPFANLTGMSDLFMSQLLSMQFLLVLLDLNLQVLYFVAQNALLLLFPLGLVLRTLFATRKLGGFLIALSLGLYILYPSFVLIFPDPSDDVQNATSQMSAFNDNSLYATMPIVDLNDNYALAGKLDLMSGRCFEEGVNGSSHCVEFTSSYAGDPPDLSGELTVISQRNSFAMSKVLLYAIIAPLFSLLITIVFVKEVASLLGSEIGLSSLASV
ncbi:MAG: hypothetical protein ABII71_02885 [Candidatus Micrarchaeota archaeon]